MGEVRYPQGYLEFQGKISTFMIYVFKVQLFNGAVVDVIESRFIPEIDMAAAQTGSDTISARRTAKNKIPMAVPMFLRSTCSTVLPTNHGKSRYTGIRYGGHPYGK